MVAFQPTFCLLPSAARRVCSRRTRSEQRLGKQGLFVLYKQGQEEEVAECLEGCKEGESQQDVSESVGPGAGRAKPKLGRVQALDNRSRTGQRKIIACCRGF